MSSWRTGYRRPRLLRQRPHRRSNRGQEGRRRGGHPNDGDCGRGAQGGGGEGVGEKARATQGNRGFLYQGQSSEISKQSYRFSSFLPVDEQSPCFRLALFFHAATWKEGQSCTPPLATPPLLYHASTSSHSTAPPLATADPRTRTSPRADPPQTPSDNAPTRQSRRRCRGGGRGCETGPSVAHRCF